ncbi:MAG: hypothetical protein P1V35_16440, partial [Planctomycetota bacterium]|nr:hypothetical protein [Planctomycetota bacterium]
MRTSQLFFMSTLVLGMTSLSFASQDTAEVVYSEIQTHSSSSVAGIPGLFVDFIDRVSVSPDGNHWILSLTVNSTLSTDDEVVIVDGAVVLREGDSPAFLPAGRNLGIFDQNMFIMNSGAFVVGGDLDGSTADDDIIIWRDAMGNFSIPAQQGMQIDGAPVGWLNDSVESPVLTDSGVGYEADFIDGGPASGMDNLMMLNGSVFLQSLVDGPAGEMAGGTETWKDFDFLDFYVSADSMQTLVQGHITGASTTDSVLVKNGVVVLQELFPIPGGPTDVVDSAGISGITMSDSGNWMARGDFDVSNDGWAVHNGVLVAEEGEPIFVGSSESYDRTFTALACNNVGDFVVAGGTDLADTSMDGVLVLNGERVIAREGAPVDLDGNGMFDDDTFYSIFGTDDMVMTDDGRVLFTCTLKNGSGSNLGDAFIILQLEGVVGEEFCSPGNINSTGASTVLSASSGTGIGSDVHLEMNNGPVGQLAYVLAGNEATAGIAVSNGQFCLVGTATAQFFRFNVGGTNMNSIGGFDASGTWVNAAGTSTTGFGFDVPATIPDTVPIVIMAGDTWHFQGWY